jgi:hypothetical protein
MGPGVRQAVRGHGWASVAPEYVLLVLLLKALHSSRSECQLIERLDYSLLFRWFVGLGMDDAAWNPAVFLQEPRLAAQPRVGTTVFRGGEQVGGIRIEPSR